MLVIERKFVFLPIAMTHFFIKFYDTQRFNSIYLLELEIPMNALQT